MVNPKFDKPARLILACLILLLVSTVLTSCIETECGKDTPCTGRSTYSQNSGIAATTENLPTRQVGLEAMRTATAPKKPVATSQP